MLNLRSQGPLQRTGKFQRADPIRLKRKFNKAAACRFTKPLHFRVLIEAQPCDPYPRDLLSAPRLVLRPGHAHRIMREDLMERKRSNPLK